MGILDFRKRFIASERLWRQICGAMLKPWLWWLLLAVAAFFIFLTSKGYITYGAIELSNHRAEKLLQLAALLFSGLIIISGCHTLTNIFSLRKRELGITVCQITILAIIGLLIIGFGIISNITNHPRFAVALSVISILMSWIFQDTIKGIVAFMHLRLNHLIHIDDWVKVPGKDVDGQVRKITLTTVTIYNWDTTTSSIPTNELLYGHFMNLQNMMTGKTYGRRMSQRFLIDLSRIHTLSDEQCAELVSNPEVLSCLPKDKIEAGVQNINLFRIYLFHRLMKHPHISQHPRLVVRWLEPSEAGLPLEVQAFITDSTLVAFERQQSLIIEHIIESMKWFGLRMYQRPSGYDVCNIYTTGEDADNQHIPQS